MTSHYDVSSDQNLVETAHAFSSYYPDHCSPLAACLSHLGLFDLLSAAGDHHVEIGRFCSLLAVLMAPCDLDRSASDHFGMGLEEVR